MTEATLTLGLRRALRARLPRAVIYKHSDSVTAGTPDLSVTWSRRTTWLEVKLFKTKLEKRELQHFQMVNLAEQGSAFYVVYSLKPDPRVYLLVPSLLDQLPDWIRFDTDLSHTQGIIKYDRLNHEAIAIAVQRLHRYAPNWEPGEKQMVHINIPHYGEGGIIKEPVTAIVGDVEEFLVGEPE